MKKVFFLEFRFKGQKFLVHNGHYDTKAEAVFFAEVYSEQFGGDPVYVCSKQIAA